MSAAPLEQLLADVNTALGGNDALPKSYSLRSATLTVTRQPIARAEEASAVGRLLAEHPTGWICTGDAVHEIVDGKANPAPVRLHEVLSGELVSAQGQRTVHLRRHGADLVAHLLTEPEGPPSALAEERSFLSNANNGAGKPLRYAIYWTADRVGSGDAAVTTYRQTHARFIGLGDK
jgi:hypothetical protein